MSTINDFSVNEINVVKDTVKERYGQPIEVELADTELRLSKGDRELTECPALYWEKDDCHFVICKIPDERFHCQFFYKGSEQFGTGINEFTDIIECVVTLLRVQADHQLQDNQQG